MPFPQGMSPLCESTEFGTTANRREPWYGVHFYQAETVNVPSCLNHANKLSLPTPNLYIPRYLLDDTYRNRACSRDVSLDVSYFNPPNCLHESALGKCWWSEDLLFLQPRSAIYVLFNKQLEWSDCYLESQMNVLAERLFDQLTSSKRYPPSIAGLHQSVSWNYKYFILVSPINIL